MEISVRTKTAFLSIITRLWDIILKSDMIGKIVNNKEDNNGVLIGTCQVKFSAENYEMMHLLKTEQRQYKPNDIK